MKKYFSILTLFIAGWAFTACEDVPEPYGINTDGITFEEDIVVTPAGSGTVDDPYNVAGLYQFVSSLANGETTADVVVKGIVSQVKNDLNPSFGNLSYYISDTGKTTDQFYVYRGLGLNGEKFKANSEVAIGDQVVVQGKVTNYNGTLEFAQNESKLLSTTNTSNGTDDKPTFLGDVVFYENALDGAIGDFTINNVQLPAGSDKVWMAAPDYHCMKASAYVNNQTQASEGWLISPVLDLRKATEAYLSFEHYGNKFNGAIESECFIMVRVVGETEWHQLTIDKYPSGSFVWTANNSLKNFVGKKIQIGFKYTSTTASAGTWEVRNVYVTGYGEKGANGLSWEDFSNGDFEQWNADGTVPEGWAKADGPAKIERSADAHGGNYALFMEGHAAQECIVLSQELNLTPGTYTCKFWTKMATTFETAPSKAPAANLLFGYAANVSASGFELVYTKTSDDDFRVEEVVYGEDWRQISYSFTLTAQDAEGNDTPFQRVRLFILSDPMPKVQSKTLDVLIDDFTIVKD